MNKIRYLFLTSVIVFCLSCALQRLQAQPDPTESFSPDAILQKTLDCMYPEDSRIAEIKGVHSSQFVYDQDKNFLYFVTKELRPHYLKASLNRGSLGNEFIRYDEGKLTYTKNDEAVRDVAVLGAVVASIQEGIRYRPFPFYHHVRDGVAYRFNKNRRLRGRTCYVVTFKRKDNFTETFFIDQEKFIILRSIRRTGKKSERVIEMKDFRKYKKIDGVRVPLFIRAYRNGTLRLIAEIDSIDFLY